MCSVCVCARARVCVRACLSVCHLIELHTSVLQTLFDFYESPYENHASGSQVEVFGVGTL